MKNELKKHSHDISAKLIRTDLSLEEKRMLIGRIEREGFQVSKAGAIYVKHPKKGHPFVKVGPGYSIPLSVGAIDNRIIYLTNTNEKFPKHYHNKLTEICNSFFQQN